MKSNQVPSSDRYIDIGRPVKAKKGIHKRKEKRMGKEKQEPKISLELVDEMEPKKVVKKMMASSMPSKPPNVA